MSGCLTFHYDVGRSGTGPGAATFLGGGWHLYNQVDNLGHIFKDNSNNPAFGGAVRGAPLYLPNWTLQRGAHAGEVHNLVFVATTDNYLYAFAEDHLRAGSKTPLWGPVDLGAPVMRTGSNIPVPIGVASTPVLDPANQRMFVMAYLESSSTTSSYKIYCVDMNDGTIIQAAQLQDAGAAGRATFDATQQDQRGALNMVNGWVFSTYADFQAYDLGNYYGWIVACNANNLYEQLFLPVSKNVLGGGCWGPGGAAADSDGYLYAGTGNGTNADGYYGANPWTSAPGNNQDYFMAVVKVALTYSGYIPSLSVVDWYQPTDIKNLNDGDLDLGSSSPIMLPDFMGFKTLAVSAKPAVYLLNRSSLGHWGNELWSKKVFTGESHSAPAYWHTPTGDHLIYFVGEGNPGLTAYKLAMGGSPPQPILNWVWNAGGGSGLNIGNIHGSPTIGSLGSSALVWIVDAIDTFSYPAALRAFDALSGNEAFNSTTVASDNLGDVPHYPGITCAGASVFVGTLKGFACYGVPLKHIKELKPEIKEHKEFKFEKLEYKDLVKIEIKENLKAEVEVKFLELPPKLKDAEGGPLQGLGGDPYAALGLMATRIDELEQRLEAGKSFIRAEERPRVGENILQQEEAKPGGNPEPKKPEPRKKKR
jgi:hypothetical protein